MRALIGLVAFVSAPAIAQGVFVSGPSDVAAALAAAQSAQQQAASANSAASAASTAASKVLAAVPSTCTLAPAMDTTNGSVGTMPGCTPPADATRATNVQVAVATAPVGSAAGTGAIVTASDGSFSGYWPRAWAAAPSYAHAEIYGTTTTYICMVVTATVSSVSGKCAQVVTTQLPGTLLALSATIINPLGTAPAGLTVRVVGRQ